MPSPGLPSDVIRNCGRWSRLVPNLTVPVPCSSDSFHFSTASVSLFIEDTPVEVLLFSHLGFERGVIFTLQFLYTKSILIFLFDFTY